MNSKNSETVGNIHVLYPKKRTQELEMEDPDFKKDWMTTATSKEFRRDYFNRPIRVNEKKKHWLQSNYTTKNNNEVITINMI